MYKKCKIIHPDYHEPKPSSQSTEEGDVDWGKCIICQQITSEILQCPAQSKRTDIDLGTGYNTLAKNIEKFHELKCLPVPLNLKKLSEGKRLEVTFNEHSAKWHKSCKMLFNNTKLERAEKRKMNEEHFETGSIGKASRRSFSGSSLTETYCFFCDESSGDLHAASTFQLDKRVRHCAEVLGDTHLLGKLSAGDMIAQGAMYHAKCLSLLYRKAENSKASASNDNKEKRHHGIALAELITYIEDTKSESDILPVFKLADLAKIYTRRLQQLDCNVTSGRIHTTELKNRILANIPDMQAISQGRDVLLIFTKDIGQAIKKACEIDYDEEAICLAKAAEIVRRDMNNMKKTVFDGMFEKNCQEKSVPESLTTLISMILAGPNIKIQSDDFAATQSTLTLSQLLLYNMTIRRRSGSNAPYHSVEREPPLPVYLGLKVHSVTRKRGLVDRLFSLGMSVSYDRVLTLSTDIGNAACTRFEEEEIVCPPKLRKGIFTTGAVDNIDHNPSSTTSQGSLHGTGISLFQHPTSVSSGDMRDVVTISENKTKSIRPLPDVYTNVPPVILRETQPTIPEVSVPHPITSLNETVSDAIQEQYRWLSHVNDVLLESTSEESEPDMHLSWSAFRSSELTSSEEHILVDLSAMLPLFQDQSKSPAMIRHAMNIIQQNVNFLNPGQTPVIAFDQPLYTLAKIIQWNCSNTHGEDKHVIMFGGLHIEIAALKTIGDWLEDSGWTAAITEAGVATSGVADSFLKASHVSRCRHAHQVTASGLYIMMQKAFSHYIETCPLNERLTFEEWRRTKTAECPTFQYWSITLEFELLILTFVESLRTANFKLYLSALIKLVPWFFALDHINYARWLPVHIRDMMTLPLLHPEIAAAFDDGHFVVRKSPKLFSSIPIDHAHEQNNKCVKGDGGIIGLTENSSEMLRWMVSGPEIARMIQDFEAAQESVVQPKNKDSSDQHHEQTKAAQSTFSKQVTSLCSVIDRMGNPFSEESTDLIVLDSRDIADQQVVETVRNIERVGKEQFQEFFDTHVVKRTKSLFDTMKKNKFPLLSCPPPRVVKKERLQVDSLQKNCSLFSQLYVSCQVRGCDLDDFFRHENQSYPPSLSQFGTLRSGNKSNLLSCLEKMSPSHETSPTVDAILLDGAAVINMLKPDKPQTFFDYAKNVFMKFIQSMLQKADRVDIVWDQYFEHSLKEATRGKRGKGIRRRVEKMAMVPGNWESFLRVDDNKTELFSFLAKECTTIQHPGKEVVTTCGNLAMSTSDRSLMSLSPCNHEEADTRLLLHVADCVNEGHTRIMLKTVDTDVVVLAVANFGKILNITEFWIAFGTGKHLRYISVNELAGSLGPQKSRALPMFHAFTGCDQTSFFAGRGKNTAWMTWMMFDEVTTALGLLSESQDFETVREHIPTFERFVILLYDRTSTCLNINDERKELFTKKGRTMEMLPPTAAALEQHIKRSVYQGGYVWGQVLSSVMELPCPSQWGWKRSQVQTWEPLWTVMPEAAKSCQQLIRCSCNPDRGCRGHCKCRKNNLRCTALCLCSGDCEQL